MRWSKMKRCLKYRPFVLDADVLSYQEAKEIFRQGFPSFEEMIAAAKRKSSLPASAWEPFDRAIAVRKRKTAFWGMLFTPVHWLRLHARTVAVACCLAIILLFFTVVPLGRAWAEAAYRYVLRVFENIVFIDDVISEEPEHENTHYLDPPDDSPCTQRVMSDSNDNNTTLFPSMEAFTKETGRNPIILPAEVAIPQMIMYECNTLYADVLESEYVTSDGKVILLRQEWHVTAPPALFITGTAFEKTILEEIPMTCSVDSSDRLFSGYAVIDDSLFSIGYNSNDVSGTILDELILFQPKS